jgi:Helicase associated domain
LEEKRERIRKREEKRKSKLAGRKNASWNDQFEKLVKFYKEHGHCAVNHRKSEFGNWVQSQRRYYKLNQLTPERILMLNSIGFDWDPKPRVPFGERVQDCIQHQTNSQVTDDEQYVIEWMKNAVAHYKSLLLSRGKNTEFSASLFAERLAELAWVKEKGFSINEKQSILQVFPNNNTLIAWAKCVRRSYKKLIDGKESNLTHDRAALLSELGFDFFPRKHYAPPGSKKKPKSNETAFVQPNDITIHADSDMPTSPGIGIDQTAICDEDLALDF